ncbi:formyltransferase family protein [Phytomonospora endophytica]|uniref:Methionyl-tRNA formyltransferase n=1 Tax=Phytomonospora endophytica TaxID=714109 RepID=A0A841G2Z8_9ACTN|nr:formyltransferase family protein [Phytomonospora endophytica]MBB6039089.1 methionyl-tRNA formyltransferase [Phytomonospora endophytica]GIG65582.1 hypothetical protein Pen01_18770 [Phytomonospora endophytica]
MIREKVLFIGDTSHWSRLAADFVGTNFEEVDAIFWNYGEPKPRIHEDWEGDRIFCFKADLILHPALLARARKSAINFHPSTPDFRGVGGYYYVLMEGAREFGATCHHMVRKIDAGSIIRVDRFRIMPGETPAELGSRTAAHCLVLFYDIVSLIREGAELPVADEKWGEKLYTRAMLHELQWENEVAAAHRSRLALMADAGAR